MYFDWFFFIIFDTFQYSKGFSGMKREFNFDFNEEAMQFWLGPFMPGVVLYHPDTCRQVLSKSGG